MKPVEIIAQDLFDKIRSRFSNLQMGDESGSVTVNPADARYFDFDFVIEQLNLGRVSISINDTGNLKVYYSQGITENADTIIQGMWFDFLREMRFFAKRRLLRFDTRDITKGNLDKTDFQYLATKDNKKMQESAMTGSLKTSHRKIENTDLIIRHSEAIDPDKSGARSRKIKNLFIQSKEGERFKFPFIYLPGARAMQRHVANGGYPHDETGKKIIETCEEILKLSDFGRKVRHATLNDNAHGIAEKAGKKLKKLRQHIDNLSKQNYYEAWKGSIQPEDQISEIDAATVESYKDAFTTNHFDESLVELFPLLHSIMQEESEIDLEAYVQEADVAEDEITNEDRFNDEFTQFESWTDRLIGEGFNDEQIRSLQDLVNEPLLVGANEEAIQALAGVGISDPTLVHALQAIAKMPNGADADARDTIKTYMGTDASKLNWGQDKTELGPEEPAPAAGTEPAAPAETPPTTESISDGNLTKWMRHALYRVNDGEVSDWTELFSELKSEFDLDDNKAEQIARRVFDAPSRGNDVEAGTDGGEVDGVDPAFDAEPDSWGRGHSASMQDSDDNTGDEVEKEDKPDSSAKGIAKIVLGFYDRIHGTWTKGEHGVVTHVKRRFSDDEGNGGEKEAALAAKLITHLNQQNQGKKEMAEVLKLSGIKIVEGRTKKVSKK